MSRASRRFRVAAIAGLVPALISSARAHDIPNARVDRSIQVEIAPAEIRATYEVAMAELTLTTDLRSLIGALEGADRPTWFRRYGEVVGPLNARGLLLTIDGEPRDWECRGYRLVVEDHPRFFFDFRAAVPERGRAKIQDTNYASSEGTSRLAVRGLPGVRVEGDDLPTDVEAIAVRPVWELTDSEELRSKQVEVVFGPAEASSRASVPSAITTETRDETTVRATSGSRLTRLLDRPPDDLLGHLGLGLFAVVIGMLHGIQPGHGKMLAVAGSVGSTRPRRTALILASSASAAHLGLVVIVAVGLAATGSTDHALVQRSLLTFSGFAIAATGAWRLGRLLRGDWTSADGAIVGEPSAGGLVRLGLAAGALPCWEAIAVFAIAAAVGRPWLGCMLVACFSLGLGLVVMLFAELGGRIASASRWKGRGAMPWIHLAGAAALLVIGCSLLFG